MTNKRISAKELRSMGFPLSNNVPDCATVPRAAISWYTKSRPSITEACALEIDLTVRFSSPFEWIAVQAVVAPAEVMP